jgi:hypothetical protein
MSTEKHKAWGWKWMSIGHDRRWPYFVTRFLNDVGNYGFRGTFRERVIKGTWFWFRNKIWWKSGLHNVYPHFRAKRGIPYKANELRYSQRARCKCGAGLAYWPAGFFLARGWRPGPHIPESHGWVCADMLTGGVQNGDIADRTISAFRGTKHLAKHDYYPFSFYDIRSEDQPNDSSQRRKVLFDLLGERYATCREVGDSTRFITRIKAHG